MRDEKKLLTRGHMLDYLIALLDNSNDFFVASSES